MLDFDLVCPFDTVALLEKSETGEDIMRMVGWASTGAKDNDDERVLQDGLDLSEVVEKGWANWNHQSEKIIGIPRVAEVRHRVENGTDFGKCVYTEFDLIKGLPLAEEVWTLAKSLLKTDRSLGLSLEGKKILQKGSDIIRAKVLNIAVAPTPKNPETTVKALVKALADVDHKGLDLFTPPTLQKSELTYRVEGIITNALTKALDATGKVNSQEQVGGDAFKVEEMDRKVVNLSPDFVEFNPTNRERLPSDPVLKRIGDALANIADSRGGKLTKAEAALFTFLVSDVTLTECFSVFGIDV